MSLDQKTLDKIDKLVKKQDYIFIPDWEPLISNFTIKGDMESAKAIYSIALKKADKFLKSSSTGMSGKLGNFTDIALSIYQKNYSVEINNEYVDRMGLNDQKWASQILEDLIPKFKDFDHLLDISKSFFGINNKKSSIELLENIIDGLVKGSILSEDYSLSYALLNCADFIGSEYDLNDSNWAFEVIEKSIEKCILADDYYQIADHILQSDWAAEDNCFIHKNFTKDLLKDIISNFIEKSKPSLESSEGDWSELAFCAQYIGAKNGFNDQFWSNKIYKMSFIKAQFQSEKQNSIFPLRDLGLHIAEYTELRGWAKEIVQLAINIAEKDPYYDKKDIDFYIYQQIDYIDKDWSSDLRKAATKGKLGPADKILFRGLYYNYAEECFSKDELIEEIKSAIENEVTLSDFIFDGFYGCDFGVDRYPDDTYFCTGASGELVIEDSAENIITTLSTEGIKTSKSDKKWSDIYPEKLCDTFRITFEDGFRGEWRKYKLNDAQIKSFDLSLLSFSVLDDGDISLHKLMYGDVEIEDYDEINDARGKSTLIDLEYFDKDGNCEVLDIDMDPKELLKIIKSK